VVSKLDKCRSAVLIGNSDVVEQSGSSVSDTDENFELEVETSSHWEAGDVGAE